MHRFQYIRWPTALPGRRRVALRYGGALLVVGLMTAVLAPLRLRLGLLNVGFLYLLLIVVIAARWGWGPSIVAAVTANLALNFFFVPPLHHFFVQEPTNVLALSVFLGLAVLTSALLARAQAGEAAARRGEQETAILYELSQLSLLDTDTAAVLTTICDHIRAAFTVDACAVLLPAEGGLAVASRSGPPDAGPVSAYEQHAATEALSTGTTVFLGAPRGRRRPRIVGVRDRGAPTAYLPLRIGSQTRGVLQVIGHLHARVFTADELRLLEAFASEAALAVDRARLVHEAARAEALHEADRLKAALLATLSHDLRSPLTAILTSASSLLQTDVVWDADTRHQFLTSIESQALRLTRLVSNLLDLSRIEGGALRPDKDWYDVRELLEGVRESLAPMLSHHRLVLTVAPDVGDAPFDHLQMSQVLSNLVENATKFAPRGSEIRVAACRDGGMLELRVTDQGPGIPADERVQIFETFYRSPHTGVRVSGTGLGLAIAKGLVEAHDGSIRVEEAAGGGACFIVRLPAPPPPVSVLAAMDRETP